MATATDGQSDLAVMDANEYKQKRRLKRILDNLEAIGDITSEAWGEYVNGAISRHGRNIKIQDAVETAVWDCRVQLLKHHQNHMRENDEPDQYWAGRPDDPIGVIPQSRSDPKVVTGLRDYLELDRMWTEEWTSTVKRRNKRAETIAQTKEHSVPERLSRQAAARLAEFLSEEKGIELATETIEVDVHAEPF